MQIEIDPHQCQASGMCAALAPARFETHRGPSTVRLPGIEHGDDDLAAVIASVDCCPGAAIRLVQEGTS